MAEAKIIKKSMLQNDLLGGLSRKEIANKYQITAAALKTLLKKAGLTLKRKSSTPVEFVDDTIETAATE